MKFLEECGDFLRQSRSHFRNTGAVLPSSRFLGRALASALKLRDGPARILEVGPGTGSVTREVLRYLISGDKLDLVELNSAFVAVLCERFERDRRFREFRRQVRVLHSAVEDLPGMGTYDFIISGLPLNNFPVAQVREIYRVYSRLLKPGGTLSYYEYALIRHLKSPFVSRRERRRLHGVGRVVGQYIKHFQFRSQPILINVPPAVVRHLRFQPLPVRAARARELA